MTHPEENRLEGPTLKPAIRDTPVMDARRALSQTTDTSHPKRKRSQVKVACAACRRSKSKVKLTRIDSRPVEEITELWVK